MIERTPLREPGEVFPATPVMTPASAFAEVDEPGAGALVGTTDSNLVPVAGDVMLYGDGGAGKTTLSVDLSFHIASGRDWLGFTIEKPATVLLIENEGPRPLFRRKLRRKLEGWGEVGELADRLWIWEEPWRGFTFAESDMRAHLAMLVFDLGVDLVVAGPVTALGMEDAGTMRDVRHFAALLEDVRDRSRRDVAFLLVHHENKGGRVSGAWEGVGDTMLHLQRRGGDGARLYVQKARWAPEVHRKAFAILWGIGDTFTRSDEVEVEGRPERAWRQIEEEILRQGGQTWSSIVNSPNVQGDAHYLAERRKEMMKEGVIINLGIANRWALWHRDDPEIPTPLDDVVEDGGGKNDHITSDVDGPHRSTLGEMSPAEVGGGSSDVVDVPLERHITTTATSPADDDVEDEVDW